MQVAGEAGAGADAVRLVRELTPEVVVMDLHMPGMTGIDAIRQIIGFAPLTRILVLTISDQDDDVLDAILAGACGYLLKDASVDELIRGIGAAAVGESLVSPAIAGKVLQQVRATAISPEAADSIRAELSGSRAGRAQADRRGQRQRDDRGPAPHQPENCQEPHLEHPDEASDREPHPGRGLRGPQRDRLADCCAAHCCGVAA